MTAAGALVWLGVLTFAFGLDRLSRREWSDGFLSLALGIVGVAFAIWAHWNIEGWG